MENPRTTSAREHDDHEMIDQAVADSEADAVVGRAGGALGRDVGTRDELTRAVADPDAHTRATKQDDIDNNDASPADRGPNRQ